MAEAGRPIHCASYRRSAKSPSTAPAARRGRAALSPVSAGWQGALVPEVGSLASGAGVGEHGGDWEPLPWLGYRYRT